MKLRWHVLMWCTLWYIMLVDHWTWQEFVYYVVCVLLPWLWLVKSELFFRTGHEAWLSLNSFRWLTFILVFFKEFLIANYKLVILTWSPRKLPQAKWIEVTTKSRSGFGRMLIANFISLTPGTISWDIAPNSNGAVIAIHLLNHAEEADVQELVNRLDPMAIALTEPHGEGRDYAIDV